MKPMAKLFRENKYGFIPDVPASEFERAVMEALEELENYARSRGVELKAEFYISLESSEILISDTRDFFVVHKFLELLYPLLKPPIYPPERKEYPEPPAGQVEFYYMTGNDEKTWWGVRF